MNKNHVKVILPKKKQRQTPTPALKLNRIREAKFTNTKTWGFKQGLSYPFKCGIRPQLGAPKVSPSGQ